MKTYKIFIYISILLLIGTNALYSQQQKPVAELTQEEMMQLTYDDLLTMSFEDLILVANKFGMSADDLLDFFLNKDVTAASKRSEKSLNSPLSTTVISKDEIINSGATSIPEVLRLVPGMIVREKTPGNYDVHIRGNDNVPPKNMFLYSENQMSLVMIDNRPVYNYSFGGTFWETLPIDLGDVERIEVIRGPSSALYGPNAVTGAINIVTKKPEGKKLNSSVNAQLGTNSAKIANAAVSMGANKFLFKMSGNYTQFNRFSDDFYVFDLGQSFSKAQIDTMKEYWLEGRSKLPVNTDEDGNVKIDDPKLSLKKYGVNASAYYDLNKEVSFEMALGLQNSDLLSNTLGNSAIPVAERTSSSNYFDFRSKFYGVQFQANQMWGDQEVQKNTRGWYINPTIRNVNLEYEKTLFGSFTIRPGVSFQQAIYSDQNHLSAQDIAERRGFLNGSRELNALAGFIRADYKAFDKLRLIAALRADKYNVPDKTYFTYQFISSYDINKTNVVRAVYSRANRGPFIVDSYANYDWQVVPQKMVDANAATSPGMYPYTLSWYGNKNLKMPVMDMIEVGYRTQPTKRIMIDIEAFHTTTSDYNYFLPDSLTLEIDFKRKIANPAATPVAKATGTVNYYNFDLKTIQSGITISANFVLNKDLQLRLFGTFQQTELQNYYDKTLWQCFDEMGAANYQKIEADGYVLTVGQTAQVVGPLYAAYGAAIVKPDGTRTAEEEIAIATYNAVPDESKFLFGEYMKMDAAVNKALSGATLTEEEAEYAAQLQRLGTLQAQNLTEKYSTDNKDIVGDKIAGDKLVKELEHKATPSFYGGFSVNYNPTFNKKLNINASLYTYSQNTLLQTKMYDIGRYTINGADKTKLTPMTYKPEDYSSIYTIEPKYILNLKVSYKVWKECSVFANTRNLLNQSKREFGYLDEIKGLYLMGINLNF